MKLTGTIGNETREFVESVPSMDWGDLHQLLVSWDRVVKAGGAPPFRVLADQPVWLGDVPLYLPTFAALARHKELGDTDILTEVWLLTNCRDPVALSQDPTPDALAALAARICCTPEEAMSAVECAYDGFPASATNIRKAEDIEDINVLALAYSLREKLGYDTDTLIWSTSMQKVLWLQQIAEHALPDTAAGAHHLLINSLKAKYAEPEPDNAE